jgi:DNA invertase Pin-like site-specific DNA recombinase
MNTKEKQDVLRVAAYIRVSTEHENQEDSYLRQKNYFEELILEHPEWILVGIYSDYGISGTTKKRRTGFNRLIRHCKEGRIDHIVTKSISRFARNTRDFLKTLNILKECRITIAFEKEHLDTKIAGNDMMLTAFGAIAQEESRSISENIRWGNEKRSMKGEVRNIPIYGYRYQEGEDAYETTESGYQFRKVEICEDQAKVVRRIFLEAARGKRYVEIAKELNEDGIAPPVREQTKEERYGKLYKGLSEGWTGDHISQMLRLERYTGAVRTAKTYTIDYKTHKVTANHGERIQYDIKDHHPAIIERELFDRVQKMRKHPSSYQRNVDNYPFTGTIVCIHCGRFYRTRNRKRNPIWYCPSSAVHTGKRVCTAGTIYEKKILQICQKGMVKRFYTEYLLSKEEKNFLCKLLDKLIMVQNIDSMESDRLFLHEKIRKEKGEKKKELIRQLEKMEDYWKELEKSYQWRQQTILWMQSLIREQKMIVDFLDGLTAERMKAFLLYIEIESSSAYRIRWFDDTWTGGGISC